MKAHGLKYYYAYLQRAKLKMKFICPLLNQLVKQPTLYYFVEKKRSLMYRLQSRCIQCHCVVDLSKTSLQGADRQN